MKILSVDAETNGLYGEPFAVGAVCTDDNQPGQLYCGRSLVSGPIDPWVLANVYPAVENIAPVGDGRYPALLADFAAWFDAHKDGAVVIAHCGTPVEARLFRDMQWFLDRDPFSGPFPLHDLATALLMAGEDPTSADGYVKKHDVMLPANVDDWSPHNPLYDAVVAEAVWRHLVGRRAEQETRP